MRNVALGWLALASMFLAACDADDPDAAYGTAASELTGAASWTISIDPAAPTARLPKELLGQYDLSGAHFRYDTVPGLAQAMGTWSPFAATLPGNVYSGVGFVEWRVGVGLALPGQMLLPTLTDGSTCAPPPFPASAFASPGTTDLDLIRSRDWFVDWGWPATEFETQLDARYDLRYVRSVIDTATRMGAKPLVNIDVMPRALAANRTPRRATSIVADACDWPLTNAVTNARPQNPDVFAAAATGLVKRVVEGSGGEPARNVTHWEVWNEPEMPYFWDPSFETAPGRLDRFFDMSVRTLVRLDAYRSGASHPNAKAIKLGLGSFAFANTAAQTLAAFEANAATKVPVDFVSFHSYHNDPAQIVADIRQVVAARNATSRYKDVELALAEWGPSLSNVEGRSMTSMDFPLLVSTVISLGAGAGLGRAHQSLFWDYYGMLPYGLLDHDVRPRPLFWAYALLARVVAGPYAGLLNASSSRLLPTGLENGELEGGMGAVLASKDAFGKTRVLFTNRNTTSRTARVDVGGVARQPTLVLSMSDPLAPPRAVAPSSIITLPARSIVLVEL